MPNFNIKYRPSPVQVVGELQAAFEEKVKNDMTFAANVAVDIAKARAPVDTGALRASIRIIHYPDTVDGRRIAMTYGTNTIHYAAYNERSHRTKSRFLRSTIPIVLRQFRQRLAT